MPKKPPCDPDEILNPASGFCVKISGKIGRQLVQQGLLVTTKINTSTKKSTKTKINTRTVDIGTCKNMSTLLNYNLQLKNVPEKYQIVKLGSGNCFIVEEIAQYWVASGLEDPFHKIYQVTNQDVNRVRKHPKLSDKTRQELNDMINTNERKISILKNDKEMGIGYVRALFALGLICRNDNTDDFVHAANALAEFNKYVETTLPGNVIKDIMTIQLRKLDISTLLLQLTQTCIHDIGIKTMFFAEDLAKELEFRPSKDPVLSPLLGKVWTKDKLQKDINNILRILRVSNTA